MGIWVVEVIKNIADLLVEKESSGWVVIMLVLFLFGFIFTFILNVWNRIQALDWFKRIILWAEDEADFGARIIEIDSEVESVKADDDSAILSGIGTFFGRRAKSQIATVWSEYRETLVTYDNGTEKILRNSARPAIFFNVEDLGFGLGFLRFVPGLFVSFGLLLTFLALISALNSIGDDAGINQSTMTDLALISAPNSTRSDAGIDQSTMKSTMTGFLTTASAKFIMSLTGLLCSILLTIILRIGIRRVESRIHEINTALECRLSFISLEDLATDQLTAIREQRDHIRSIGLDLVAELADRLTRDLPEAIGTRMTTSVANVVKPLESLPAEVSQSLENALGPIMEKVGQAGSEGMGDMVRDLSSRLSSDVSDALAQASGRIAEAGERIGGLVDRMDQSSGRMGGEMETAVARLGQAVDDLQTAMTSSASTTATAFQAGADQLLGAMNETLQGIRDNTADGASAMREAAAEMRNAAEGIRQELEVAAKQGADAARGRMEEAGEAASGAINAAGLEVSSAFGKTSAEIARLTSEIGDKASKDLFGPLDTMASKLEDMASALSVSTGEVRRASDGIRAGADASTEAAGTFRGSAQTLAQAAEPIRASVEGLGSSTTELVEGTRRIAETAQANANSIKTVIEAAQAALAAERDGVRATLKGIGEALEKLQSQGDRLDDMDEKLGEAFERYTNEVATAVDGLFEHTRKMQEELAPAVDTLRDVVEQAEQFAPQSRSE